MPRDPTRNQVSNGLSYNKVVPSFLANFGKPTASRSPPPEHHPSYDPRIHGRDAPGRGGREPLPERPKDGEWAGGSDGEDDVDGRKRRRKMAHDSDDEWGDVYGGGGDEGPQVVVLKEGRHLSEAEVRRERRRGRPIGLLKTDCLADSSCWEAVRVAPSRVRQGRCWDLGEGHQRPAGNNINGNREEGEGCRAETRSCVGEAETRRARRGERRTEGRCSGAEKEEEVQAGKGPAEL